MKIELSFSLNLTEKELAMVTGDAVRQQKHEELSNITSVLAAIVKAKIKPKAAEPNAAQPQPEAAEPQPDIAKEEEKVVHELKTPITKEMIEKFSQHFGYSQSAVYNILQQNNISTIEEFMASDLSETFKEYVRENF